jgi:hypothetical protein
MTNEASIGEELSRSLFIKAGHRCALRGEPLSLERAKIYSWNESGKPHFICLCETCYEDAVNGRIDGSKLSESEAQPWIKGAFAIEAKEVATYKVEWFIDSTPQEFDEGAQRWLIDSIAAYLKMAAAAVKITQIERFKWLKVTTELPAERADWLLFVIESERAELDEFLKPVSVNEVRRQPSVPIRWMFGRQLKPDAFLPPYEDEVSHLIQLIRKPRHNLLQWWHPSLLTGLCLNFISALVMSYGYYYYWPLQLALMNHKQVLLTEGERRQKTRALFQRICVFRLFRTALFWFFSILILAQYLLPNLSDAYVPRLLAHLLIISFFLLLLIDNLLCQWAELSTFLKAENMTIISLFLCRKSSRDTLWEFRRLFMNDVFGPSSFPSKAKDNKEFIAKVKEHVEELHAGQIEVKAEVFRLAILPLRHVFGVLLIWGLMIMSLQLHCGGEAFTRLRLQPVESRSLRTFLWDMRGCLYLSAGTVATNAYGEIHPETSDEFQNDPEARVKEDARSYLMKSPSWIRTWVLLATVIIIVTILGTFNLAFRSVDVVMTRLESPESVAEAITSFVSAYYPYPLIH